MGRKPWSCARKSIIPHPSCFCQVFFGKKLHKIFSQNLCKITIAFLGVIAYNNKYQGEMLQTTASELIKNSSKKNKKPLDNL